MKTKNLIECSLFGTVAKEENCKYCAYKESYKNRVLKCQHK